MGGTGVYGWEGGDRAMRKENGRMIRTQIFYRDFDR
jgi:hypothetical protein